MLTGHIVSKNLIIENRTKFEKLEIVANDISYRASLKNKSNRNMDPRV